MAITIMSPGQIKYVLEHPLRIDIVPGLWLRSAETGNVCVIFRMSIAIAENHSDKCWYPTQIELLEVGKKEAKVFAPDQVYRWIENRQLCFYKIDD